MMLEPEVQGSVFIYNIIIPLGYYYINNGGLGMTIWWQKLYLSLLIWMISLAQDDGDDSQMETSFEQSILWFTFQLWNQNEQGTPPSMGDCCHWTCFMPQDKMGSFTGSQHVQQGPDSHCQSWTSRARLECKKKTRIWRTCCRACFNDLSKSFRFPGIAKPQI